MASGAERLHDVEIGGLIFDADFDSGNASTRIEALGDHEFSLWTLRDCEGTEFENGCRTVRVRDAQAVLW